MGVFLAFCSLYTTFVTEKEGKDYARDKTA